MGALLASKLFAPLLIGGLMLGVVGVQQYRIVSLRNDIANMVIAQQDAIIEAQRLAREDQIERDELSKIAAVNAALAQRKIETVTNTIIREVPSYVPNEDATGARFVVPHGFVLVHDAAASGRTTIEVPNTTGQSNDTPSAIDMSRVASVLAQNYGACRLNAQQLSGLQAWVQAQERVVLGVAGSD